MNLNGKQIILLVCGLFFLIAIACLSTWALVGGSSNQLDESGSTEEKSLEVTSHRQRPRYHFWTGRPGIDLLPLKLEAVKTKQAFVDENGENYRKNKSDTVLQNWPELLDSVDLYKGDNSAIKNHRMDTNGADLITLSYLSLSVYLLKQMDRLLDAQSEVMASSRSLEQGEKKSRFFNSLNILLVDSKRLENITDIDDIKAEDLSDNYAQLGVNLIKASQMKRAEGSGIDCVWTAYCIELNNRASLKGMVGSIARINGIVLGLMSGRLVPRQALERLVPSLIKWTDLQCHTLFPKCGAAEAMEYLRQLAHTPNE